ncbi:MAG: EpsG family protein [Porphyromonas sp.]|uniref:EpsG family protein n=1 Tax=Porphyromonas sp. TaxID=1924944 RepID=UPI002A75164E|nr:EpsG family protein [Porphyromonas sp.]MDD6929080.1 EpsG family protein [Bacteroidales bacterium]MDY3111371.1 EpsG family protein [Porphyromonas sp.]
MIPYIILLSLLLLFTALYYRDQRFEGLYQLFTFALLVGFAGLRVGLGQDYEVYENGYNWVTSESFQAFEPLWRGVILGMHAVGLSFRSFMILTSAITIALFFRGIRQLSISYPLGILFFVLFNTGYLETLNGVRQCLALMITFAAFHLYVERRYWRFFLWVVLSCLVHSSSVIWFILLPLMSIRWDWRVLTALLVVTLAVGTPLFKVVGSVLEPILPERYAFYISSREVDAHQGWVNILVQNGMTLLLLIGSLYLGKERDRVTCLAILLIAFSSMIYNCTLSSDVAMRFMYNPGIMICVALPNLLLSVKDRWYQLTIAGVMILYFLFTVNNVMDPSSSLHTYRWVYDDYIYTPTLW